MAGNKKRKLDEEPTEGPPPKKAARGSVHKLSQRHSNVTDDWDKHLGAAIAHFSPLHLPTVRTVLQRYRHLRTESPREKKNDIALAIAKEIIPLWEKAWIPHLDELATYKAVLKQIDTWALSSKRKETRGKSEFQDSLNQLFDIRPVKMRSIEELEKYLKSSRR